MPENDLVSVRYIVDDVDASIDFYTHHFGFEAGLNAAPAPAPAPRTQSGGEPARKRAASARMTASPGTMKAAPPRNAADRPPTRQAQ